MIIPFEAQQALLNNALRGERTVTIQGNRGTGRTTALLLDWMQHVDRFGSNTESVFITPHANGLYQAAQDLGSSLIIQRGSVTYLGRKLKVVDTTRNAETALETAWRLAGYMFTWVGLDFLDDESYAATHLLGQCRSIQPGVQTRLVMSRDIPYRLRGEIITI